MAKKIKVGVELDDKQAKKKLEDLEKGKYKVNVDVNAESVNQANENMKRFGKTASNTNGIFGKLKETITNTFSTSRLTMTGFLTALAGIHKAGNEAVETVKSLDKEITDLSAATDMSRESVSGLLQNYNKLAKEMKATTVDVSQAANDYLRAGKSMSESQELIKSSLMLSKLGQIDASTATEDLLAIINGFSMSVDEVNKSLDSLVAVDMAAATSAGSISEALKYCASNAEVAGISFDKLVAILAEVQDRTQLSSQTIGTFMNTILSRYKDVKIGNYLSDDGEDLSDYESVLKSIGISLRDSENEFRNYEDVLQDMASKWNTLSSVQQAALAKTASGVRMQNRFYALMEGYSKVLDLTKVSAESAGTAIDKYNKAYANSLEAKQANLQASFESMIMNSDFSSIYSDILDSTNALVEFLDKTNALKGALSGLVVGTLIKGFMSIKSGITQAYVTLNKFQNAMNLVKKTKISTNDFQRLLLLSDGLSKSQMKLILSTNTLSVAQKKELLIASGLSEEESELALNTWKMSAANNGLTASTTSVGNSLKALFTMIKANPLGLIVTGIGIGVAAWQKYKQSIEEAVSSASDAANTYKEQNDAIDEAVTKYQELRQQLIAAKGNEEETYAIKQQLLELQTELNEKFGIEAGRINLVTDAYRDQTEAIKALNKESGQMFLNENRKGIEQATKQMESDKTYLLGTTNGLVNASELKYLDKIGQIASANNIQRTNNGFEFVGNARDASKSINNFMNQIKELQKEAGNTSSVLSGIFDGILDNSGDALSEANGIIEKYGDIYEQAQLAQISSDRNLSQTYNEATAAVEAYNDAVLKSENPYDDQEVQNAWNRLQNVKQEIKDNEAEWGQYSNIVDNVFSEANDAVYSFYQTISNDQSVSKFVDDLRGLTDIDLQAMADDGNNGDAFDKLCEKAENYGLEVQNVIDLLIQLGVVQGQIDDEVGSTDISPKWDYSTTITQLDEMEKKFSSLDNAYSKLFDEDSNIGFEDYSSIYDAFKDIEGLDIGGYIKQLQEAGQNQELVQETMDSLVSSYLNLSGILDNVTDENARLIASFLEEQGVANAEAVVMNYLAAQTEYAAIAKDNAAYSSAVLAEATLQDINNILMEGSVTEDTKNQIIAYYLEKLTASGISLDTAEDCNQLMNLISALGGATSALSIYYSALQGSMNVSAVNGSNSHGGLSGKDTPYLEQMAKVQAQKEAEKKLNEMLEKTQNSMSKVSFKGGTKSNGVRKSQAKGSGGSGGKGSGSKSKDNDAEEAAKKAEEERKKAIEEEEKRLEDALSRIKNAIAELDKQASNSFHNWDERNSALQAEMDAIPQAIAAQQQLVDFYNSTGNDPTKAQEAANAIADLKRQLEELANQKLENIKKFNEDIISLIDSLKELSQSLIDIKEARGFSYSEGDYQELIAKTEEERRQYEKELSELQAQLQENIDKGYLQEGSETWYEWQKELNGIKKSINECTKAQIEWNKEIQNIPFTALENFHKLISKATDRLDKFEAQLSARGLSKSFANIQEDLMAVNEELLIAQSEATQYYEVIRKNLSDDTNGWARLTEEQIKQIFKYIDTDDSLSLHNYMSSLGYDNYTLKEFYEYIEKLSEANSEIIELKTQQIELNNAINDLDVTGAEKFAVLIEKLNSEISDENNILDARGVSKNIEDIKNEYHGLASTVIVEQNKINHYYSALYRGLSDGVNGWANLTYEEIDKVFKYIQQNDTNSLFNFLNSKQINPATLDGFWELVENIQTANSNIASATANQIQLNKAIQQMDISVYENLSNVLSEIKTRIEGIRSIVEAHKRNPADELIQMQIDTGMDQIKLYRSMINAYKEYIRKQLSDGKNGWANLAGDQIQDIMGFVESGDTNGLEKYLNTLGLSIATMDEFNEVLGKITSTSSNMYSEMASQETRFDDMLEVRINKLNEVQEQLQKINDEKNKALQLEKARYALIEAQNNRNVMTWDGNQMVWTNDKNKVSDALDNLRNLEFQDLIDTIQDAIDTIEDLMKNKNIYDEWGNLTGGWQNTIDSALNKADAIMTELISKLNAQGYNVRIPAFATGGAIQGLSGDNNLIRVADKERVLTPIQNTAFEKLVDFSTSFIPQLEDITKNLVPLTNFDAIRKVDTATQNVYQFNGDFVMPNVHDGSKVNDLIKDLNSITLKAQQRVNRIN